MVKDIFTHSCMLFMWHISTYARGVEDQHLPIELRGLLRRINVDGSIARWTSKPCFAWVPRMPRKGRDDMATMLSPMMQ